MIRPLLGATPPALAREIAKRVIIRRLALGWTRTELAARSGIAPETLKRFEQSGRIALERLLKIAVVLGATRELGLLFPEPPVASLAELAKRGQRRGRVRGRRIISVVREQTGSSRKQTDREDDAPT